MTKPRRTDPGASATLDLANSAGIEKAALDLLPSGIGIFGNDFRLVYANRSFRTLRFLPERLCVPGTPLEDIVRHIATRGDYGVGEVDTLVKDRMAETLALKPWNAEQDIEGRRRLAIRHIPVPGLGFMITYADVTEEPRRSGSCGKTRSAIRALARRSPKESTTGTSLIPRSTSPTGCWRFSASKGA